MALQTTVEHVEGRVPITVLALDGELDASNFERLIEEVRGLYAAGDRTLLLDLSGLTFMASSGLVALHAIVLVMHGERTARPRGWLVRLPCVDQRRRRWRTPDRGPAVRRPARRHPRARADGAGPAVRVPSRSRDRDRRDLTRRPGRP